MNLHNPFKHHSLLTLIANSWRDLSLSIKGMIVISLPLTLLLGALSLLYLTEKQLSQFENKLKIALENQRDIQTIHSQLLESSSGVKDYLLTNDQQFLVHFYRFKAQLPNLIKLLDSQLENQAQKQKMRNIRILVKQNLDTLTILSEDDSEQASPALIAQFKLQIQNLDKIRHQIESLDADEALLVQKEQENVTLQRQRNFIITLMFAAIGIIGSVLAMWIFSNTIVKRVKLIRDSASHLARAEALELPSSSQDELGQLTDALEQASHLLVKNIHQATLAKQEAEDANMAKSQFLSRTSHELRTPLNSILGFAQLLEDDLPIGKDKDHVHIIKGAGEHLLKLINEVLDIARIESGEHSLTLKPCHINDLINEAIHYIAPLGKIRDIDITQQTESNLVGLADKQKLLQVVLNLLSNALKYGPVSSTVLLKAYRKEQSIIIEVFDEGAGIPQNLKSRLFTPFDRLGAEQSKIEGTGLGLALSKHIMHAMQGDIFVADHISLFWVSFQAVDGTISSFSHSLPSPKLNQILPLKHPILYVEDNASNRALVEAIIKRQPLLTLHTASTIREAKMLLNELKFALCILDLNLPDGSGEDLFTYIKSIDSLKKLPIMILSADAVEATIDRLKAKGVQSYMTKPLNIAQFTEQVKQLTLEQDSL